MIFEFVVRHLKWAARIPLAPQIFDAALLAHAVLCKPETFRAIQTFERAMLNLPRVELRPHKFGGAGFNIGAVEFAHIHGNGLLDIRLTRALADSLVRDRRAKPHHVLGPSAWITLTLTCESDLPGAIEIAAAAHSLI